MHTLTHEEPIIGKHEIRTSEVLFLADAFSEFISASASLEKSYENLKLEVAQLSEELAERNCALKVSIAENERIHQALQQIVHSLPCGVLVVVESTGDLVMINPEALNLLGVQTAPIEKLHEVCRSAGLELDVFLGQCSEFDGEHEFHRIAGKTEQWLSVNKRSLLLGNADEIDRSSQKQTILILRDITAQKNAEAERERARRAIALSEVATTLAHEIRNPLTSLELFTELIAKGGSDVPLYVSHLHAGIRSLAGTVNNVLAIHGNGFPSMKPLNLVDALRSGVAFSRPIADEAGVVLSFSYGDDLIKIQGNVSALQQLILNIVCNAIRHTPRGGSISVTVENDANKSSIARISFSDTGEGISEEDLPHIFSLGFSGNGASSGLGLAVCKQVANQHRGRIDVISKLTVGTTFFVEIPTI